MEVELSVLELQLAHKVEENKSLIIFLTASLTYIKKKKCSDEKVPFQQY